MMNVDEMDSRADMEVADIVRAAEEFEEKRLQFISGINVESGVPMSSSPKRHSLTMPKTADMFLDHGAGQAATSHTGSSPLPMKRDVFRSSPILSHDSGTRSPFKVANSSNDSGGSHSPAPPGGK